MSPIIGAARIYHVVGKFGQVALKLYVDGPHSNLLGIESSGIGLKSFIF